ncbi:MAG: YhdP family protein [Burkholderiales bacterium]
MSIETILENIDLPPQSRWRVAARIAGWALVAAYFVFVAIVLALRYWILPNIGGYAGAIEQSVSKALGERVTIGAIEAGWQGLRPELFLANVTLHDRSGRAALSLPGIEATLSWTSVLYGSLHFYSLVFDRPRLEIRRDKAGKLYVAGFELRPEEQGGAGMAQWLLSQREVRIRDASVTWDDDLRGAPQLALPALDFVLRNGIDTHRFALKAKPPADLASALDVRGELHGGVVEAPEAWSGQLYAELEYTDLTVWQRWFDYPLEIRSGKGGLRLWLGFAGKQLTEAVADVALSQVVLRVAKDLPLIELDYLQGRLGARQSRGETFEVFGRKVALKTGAGVALQPADFSVRWQPGDGRTPPKGEMQANALDFAPLAKLSEYLPLPRQVRARLAATEPRGSVHDLKLAWTGEADNPQSYSVRGRFANLGARTHDGVPGFAGLTGRVDADEKSGDLLLASENAAIELPGIVAENRVQFDSLTGRIGWKSAPDHIELSFGNLSFANRDIAGTLFGSFFTKAGSPGVVDLTGNFSRTEAPTVYRYIPFLPAPVAEYLKSAMLGGSSNEIRLRLKGDLRNFPFADPRLGTFQVAAKVSRARFRYAESWPQADEMSGDLIFEGQGMRIAASKASVLGVRVNNVRAGIPDLFHDAAQLHLEIRAEDQTAAFLGFIDGSPIARLLDGSTEGVRATGGGQLQFALDLPIGRPERIKVAGSYQFNNDQIRFDADSPPLAQVNGRLEFTESGVTARSVSARFLGGPAAISLVARVDGTIVASAQGTADMAQLPRSWDAPLLRRISGSTAWRATLTGARNRPLTLAIDSQLAGLSIDLPAPLGKTATDIRPLRVERVIDADPERSGQSGTRGDSIKVSLGDNISGQVQRRKEGGRFVIERGVVSFNEPPVLPERPGIAIIGSLPYVDFDRWRALLSGDEGGGLTLSSLDLRVAALDFAGRRLNDLGIRAGASGGVWVANVTAKELAGEITWQPEGRGRIVARLKHFAIPEPAAGATDAGSPSRDMPSLDLVADNLVVRDRSLGRLELVAVNEANDLRIEKLVLSNPESTLNADGVWQSWAARPSISVNVRLEVSDIGKYLDRIGYPHTMQHGVAKLEGKVGWAGNPQTVDYPTLTGNLRLEASNGQFLKVEPGVARLLGILSMQSWITLDFRDLFGQGFAFDRLSGTATVAKGVLTTRDFHMRGPSAQVNMSGDVGLAGETQNLRVRVVPSLGNSLSSIAVIVLNPVWGLGTLFAQQILKDPLGQIFAFEYGVTGTWTEPHVDRIKAEARPPDTATQSP